MKRYGHLWDRIVSFEALLRASDAARRGKRFLGYRVFPTHRLMPKENVRRFRRRVRRMQEEYAAGRVSIGEVHQRLMSWNGHARQANTYRLRGRLFSTIRLQRATTQ